MAPRVFISYTHDSPEHEDNVWELSEKLRKNGVDCRIDQQEESPAEGWPRWCRNQIQDATFVLVVCTEIYLRRYEGKDEVGKGRGGKWEGFVITQEIYDAEGRNTKFIPVVLNGKDVAHIPLELHGATYYDAGQSDGHEKLLRRVLGKPLRKASDIGEAPPLPTLDRRSAPPPKQLFTVPLPENPFFTGREEVLEELKKTLDDRGIAALTGLGGMGKTQTAAQYAHHHRKDYPWVLWVRAESQETLFADLSQLAARLELPEREAKDQSVIVEAVKLWLDEHEGWLLILDNVEDYGVVRDLTRKANANGHHVVITTQTSAMGQIRRQALSPMDRDLGALLLLRRANRMAGDAPLSSADPKDAALAREISDEVGGLPLALDQAGAYLEETGAGLGDYLGLLRERSKELLDRRGGLDSDHLSVAATYLTSFEKLAKQNQAAAELLQAAAFLAPDAIPEEIFTEGTAEFSQVLQGAASDPIKWDEAIAGAFKFSLIERNPSKMLAVHRMVQAVVKSRMSAEERAQWAEQVVRAVNTAFPSAEFAFWDKCERLVASAQACAALVEEYHVSSSAAGLLLNEAGYYLYQRARYAEAEPLMRRALAVDEHSLGSDHANVAIRLNNLAELLRVTNRLGEAEPLYRRALAISEKSLGQDHPTVAIRLNNLAVLLQATNRLGEAESLHRRALAIWEKALGANHPQVAFSLNNLAQLLKATNRLREAEPLMRRALAIDEHSHCQDHPDVARDLNNLALSLRDTNRLGEAEPLMQRALAILEKSLGRDHPNTLTARENLAVLLRELGRDGEADKL